MRFPPGHRSLAALAATCQTDARATGALLALLAGDGYVAETRGVWRMTPKARRWLQRGSPDDVSAYIRYNYLQWDWLSDLERFIQTGQPTRLSRAAQPRRLAAV